MPGRDIAPPGWLKRTQEGATPLSSDQAEFGHRHD